MTHTPGPGESFAIVAGHDHDFITTANTDGTLSLNTIVVGKIDLHDDAARAKEMIHRANTQPDLLAAAQAMLAKLENLTPAEFERGGERAERDALAKAIAKACQS